MRPASGYVVTLVLATITGLGVAACTEPDMSGMPGMNEGPLPSGVNKTDLEFAQMMIPHHAQAVEMATLAETRAADPELKQLAAGIKAAQQPEIDTMNGWLTSWGQPSAMSSSMPNMPMPGMQSRRAMDSLKRAKGVDFDRTFLRMMIDHHKGAIEMSRDVSDRGVNPQVKTLAATIERTQAAEIAQMEKILDRL